MGAELAADPGRERPQPRLNERPGVRDAAAVVAVVVLVHLVWAQCFRLSPDEAHYALYGLHPDWSYFDHPPLVGWLQWPWVALGGAEFALRLWPQVSWAAAAWGLFEVTARLFPTSSGWGHEGDARRGFWPSLWRRAWATPAHSTLTLWVLSPLPHLIGLALVPDTLLLPLTCAAMLLTWRLCQSGSGQPLRAWMGLGLVLGLAGLAKYTAVFLALGCLVALIRAHGGRLLWQPGFWLASVLALGLVSPVLIWNARHDWISFAYQFGHAAGQQTWRLSRVAVFALIQGTVFGPLLGCGLWGAWIGLRQAGGAGGGEARLRAVMFLAGFGLPLLLVLMWLSGRGATLPHWASPAWVALVPLAGAGCHWLAQRRPQGSRVLAMLMAWQLLCCLAMVALILAAGVGSETGDQARSRPGEAREAAPRNPVADLYGWDAAGEQARALAQSHGVSTLAVMNWSLASRLAWYARPLPIKTMGPRVNQFTLWFGPLQPGESAVLVDWSLMTFEPPVGPGQFEQCTLLEQQAVTHAGRQLAHFNHLLCRNWQGPPARNP